MAQTAFSNGLTLFGDYFIVGYVSAFIYEVTRTVFPRKIAWVWDFLFMCAAAVVLYAYNLEFESADGRFRWFYGAGALLGGLLYLITLHKAVYFACGFIRGVVIKIFTKILRFFVNIAIFAVKHLKSLYILVYNYITSLKQKLKTKAAERSKARRTRIAAAKAKAARPQGITVSQAKTIQNGVSQNEATGQKRRIVARAVPQQR